nr:hypothetical protein [Tanacetum cinerariifolium]
MGTSKGLLPHLPLPQMPSIYRSTHSTPMLQVLAIIAGRQEPEVSVGYHAHSLIINFNQMDKSQQHPTNQKSPSGVAHAF